MIKVNGEKIKVEYYPDGTQRLNIKPRSFNIIEWSYETEEELVTLIYITKHLKSSFVCKSVSLYMSYLPNARMDRTKNEEEVFTLKYFADVINWLEFNRVYVLDVHSDVSKCLINKCDFKNPLHHIKNALETISKNDMSDIILYYPDAGSAKRYSEILSQYRYCYGEKKRDWKTGKILGLEIKTNGIDLNEKTILMIDDIVSYGGSLYYSANTLKEYGVDKIYAYATHTENSILDKEKGTLIKALENNTVEKLFTTNSLFTGTHEKIEVVEEVEKI